MFKPFFVHINPFPPGKRSGRGPRGSTIYVSPSKDNRQCQVQATFCSHKDEYNKKTGRAEAMKADIAVINKRDLPRMVAAIEAVVEPVKPQHTDDYVKQLTWSHYQLLRNFV